MTWIKIKTIVFRRDVEIATTLCGISGAGAGWVSNALLGYHFTLPGILTGIASFVFSLVPACYLISFHRYKKLPFGKLPVYGLSVVAILLLVGALVTWWKFCEPEETQTHGWLLPAYDPHPKTNCGEPSKQSGWIHVVLGQAEVTTATEKPLTILSIADRPAIKAHKGCAKYCGHDGLLFDVDMYNQDGSLAVHIEQNEWQSILGQYSYLKRPDRSTLIVFDRVGNELLWIRYLNSTTVKIRGTFNYPGHGIVKIDSDTVGITKGINLYLAMLTAPVNFMPCFVMANTELQVPIFTVR